MLVNKEGIFLPKLFLDAPTLSCCETMSLDIAAQMELILGNTVEIVTREKLEFLLNEKEKRTAYVGFEPSGKVHLGWLIIADKIKHLNLCGFHVTVYLADWHAYINDKFGGDIDRIRKCGRYMEDCFQALGVDPERNSFVYASELLDSISYWEKVFKVAKRTSMARLKRAMTIMGRSGDEAEVDSSKFFYPAMQVTDIFHLEVDLALGGQDQRRAHMLALDVAEKLQWKKPLALHTPIIAGLDSGGRMDMAEAKMSKSSPDSCLFIHDDGATIIRKLKKAFCPQGELEGNPIIDLATYIIFPQLGEITIKRPEKWGGDMFFSTLSPFLESYESGQIHPLDLKIAVAEGLGKILEPVHGKLCEKYGSLAKIEELDFN